MVETWEQEHTEQGVSGRGGKYDMHPEPALSTLIEKIIIFE